MKKIAVNRKIRYLTKKIQAVKKFRMNLKNHKLMRKVQVMKKKANLTKANRKKEILKKTKTQRKKMNLKLWMKRKRRNF